MPQEINSIYYKAALQYNQDNSEKINNICAPLKECFGIHSFGYSRVFDQGKYILISNDPIYTKFSICYDYPLNTKFFKNCAQNISKYKSYKLLWLENTGDELIESLYAQGICNGYNIMKERKGSLECYFFGSTKDFPSIRNLYSNFPSILEDFITYFHKVAGELLDASDTSKQGVFPYIRDTYPRIEKIFEQTTLWEKEIIKFNSSLNSKVREEIFEIGKRNNLTPRELQCISYLSAGKTAKEIAKTINIGPRTVETHINKIRQKTKCCTKNELTDWFKKTFKYLLEDLPLIN